MLVMSNATVSDTIRLLDDMLHEVLYLSHLLLIQNTILSLCHVYNNFFSSKEVETEQYFTLFLPALKDRGYDGFFSPKSRAKIMSEQERKHVDGCAIFFKTEK